uniref:hypothetical protein n=1 Tax=Bacillus licheniformis TaxID=1402 RepID=UPI003B586177
KRDTHHSLIKVNSDTQIKAMKNEAKREEHSEPDRASLAALVSGDYMKYVFWTCCLTMLGFLPKYG